MSSVDLENLDNKSLRAKCLEYGLPNVPITDTSRKLLIRKLRAAMDGTNTTKDKPKAKRETIHVTEIINALTKPTPKKDTPKKVMQSNSRRTIAGGTVQEAMSPVERPIERRRLSRVQDDIPVAVSRKQPPQPILEENNYSGNDFILIEDDNPLNYPQQISVTTSRKSRSPSLGKSAIITTSYKKETAAQAHQQPIPEDESESDEPSSPIGGQRSKIQNSDIVNSQFIPYRSIAVESTAVPRYSQPSTYLNRSIEREEYPTGYKSIYPTLNTVAAADTSKLSYDNTTTRRYTTSGLTQPTKLSNYNAPGTTKRITVQHHYTENSDSNEDDNGGGGDGAELEEEAPYLSDFARRLSRLKAEPIDIGYKKDLSELREHRYGNSVIGNRRSNYSARRNSTVADSFKEFWFALDYKYNIMRKFIILCLLATVILAIYFYNNYNN